MQLLESHNQCPDCVLMELQAVPHDHNPQQFDLCLNLKYSQQQEEILSGKVKFTLRSSYLLLNFKNINFIPHNTLNSSIINLVNDSLSTEVKWQIFTNTGDKFLSGDFNNIQLGTIEIKDNDYQLVAQIITKKSDIYFTDIEGLWHHDITPNKHAILERKLAEYIEKTQFNPYASQIVFGSENNQFIPDLHHREKANLIDEESLKLKNTIVVIYQSTNNKFTELAELAELNLLSDFAGGDLTGVNLSGLNLSGANFSYANLRGADLTDTDLSESNLKYIKLSGADLSGAYLEGSNLQNANLQNASLALANLIGANLSYANLTNTNLQNTSLGQTNLKNAIFSQNLGLDEQKKQDLINEGAIFN